FLLLLFSHYPAPPSISPLSLHDALPIYRERAHDRIGIVEALEIDHAAALGVTEPELGHERTEEVALVVGHHAVGYEDLGYDKARSEEHTSELQSPCNLVCRLLLEKKKKT